MSYPAPRYYGDTGEVSASFRRGGGPDAHFHKTISESFFVLFGAVRLYDGARWIEATTGDFLFVPEGGITRSRTKVGRRRRCCCSSHLAPPREDYFEILAEVASGRVLSEEERIEFYLKHDTYWL